MTVKLFLRPSPVRAEEGVFQWALFSYGGEPLGTGEDTLDQLTAQLQQNGVTEARVHYVIPASLVTLCRAAIPARQARYVQQALPYAVEELLADDVEQMHLVLCQRQDRDIWPVVAIQHEVMSEYHALVSQLPWPLQAIHIDAEGCAAAPGEVGLLIDGDAVLIHQPGHHLVRLARANALPFLEALGAAAGAAALPLKVQVNPVDEESDRVFTAQLEHVQGLEARQVGYGVSPFELICHTLANLDAPINLCEGPYRSQATREEGQWRRWWPLAAVAGFFLVVQVGLLVTEGLLNRQHAEAYEQQALQLYRSIYPQERTVMNPRRQMEGKLRNAGSSGGQARFLDVLAEAGYLLRQQPGSDNMELNNVQYNQRGELALEIRAGTLDQLDRYRQALTTAGLNADLGAAIKESNGVRGRVTIRG